MREQGIRPHWLMSFIVENYTRHSDCDMLFSISHQLCCVRKKKRMLFKAQLMSQVASIPEMAQLVLMVAKIQTAWNIWQAALRTVLKASSHAQFKTVAKLPLLCSYRNVFTDQNNMNSTNGTANSRTTRATNFTESWICLVIFQPLPLVVVQNITESGFRNQSRERISRW